MTRPLLSTILAGCCLLAVGCSTDKNDVSDSAILGDLSPELMGINRRPEDVNRNINVTADINSRSFIDDIGRTVYWDHPSRLSPMPIIDTSGRAR
jgi:hypothetical protein